MPTETKIIRAHITERRRSQLDEFLPELEAGIKAGAMPNPRYTKAKEAVGRALEAAWVEHVRKPFAWNRDYIQAATEAEQSLLDELGDTPQTNNIAKLNRTAGKMDDTPAARAARALLAEVTPILNMIKQAKGITVKKGAAPKPPSATEIYSAPTASGTAMAQVHAELTTITRNARDSIAATLADRHRGLVDRFMRDFETYRQAPREERGSRFDIYSWARSLGQGKADGVIMAKLQMTLDDRFDRDTGLKIFSHKPDMDQIIRRQSLDHADGICAQFIDKNMSKLASIIEGRGDFREMKVLGRSVNPGAMEGRLRMSFGGDASFEARTQAVMSFSPLGTPFMRFPLTFHDVRMSNGEKMERPSERKMNEVFVTETAEAPQP